VILDFLAASGIGETLRLGNGQGRPQISLGVEGRRLRLRGSLPRGKRNIFTRSGH
jgi:hypothetical protein